MLMKQCSILFLLSVICVTPNFLEGKRNNRIVPYSVNSQTASPEQQIRNLMRTVSGEIGVAAMHLESGRRIEVNADKKFPMASTSKLPISLYCLALVDKGFLDLDQTEMFTRYDMRRGCYDIIPHQEYSYKRLIRLSIEISDNVAPDKILKVVGGGEAVTDWLHQKGIYGMRVDRSTFQFLADYAGANIDRDEDHCTVEHYIRCLDQVSNKKRLQAQKTFFDDERDTTTPRAMVDLLEKLYKGRLVSLSSSDFMLNCMLHCHWGKQRVKRFIPKGTKYCHKTGTIDGIVSDVGIIKLPNNKGHVALALYTNRAVLGKVKREHVLGKIGRVLFNYFS